MCYAIPGRVVAVDGRSITVEYYGQYRTVRNETLDPHAHRSALQAGCSSVMLNVTPMQYSRLCCIHPNRAHGGESIER